MASMRRLLAVRRLPAPRTPPSALAPPTFLRGLRTARPAEIGPLVAGIGFAAAIYGTKLLLQAANSRKFKEAMGEAPAERDADEPRQKPKQDAGPWEKAPKLPETRQHGRPALLYCCNGSRAPCGGALPLELLGSGGPPVPADPKDVGQGQGRIP